MDDTDEEKCKAVMEAVMIPLMKLQLQPGEILAMIAPKEWTPGQIAIYSHYASTVIQHELPPGCKLVVFPHGMQLSVIHQEQEQ